MIDSGQTVLKQIGEMQLTQEWNFSWTKQRSQYSYHIEHTNWDNKTNNWYNYPTKKEAMTKFKEVINQLKVGA